MSSNPFTDDPEPNFTFPVDQQSFVIDSEGFLINGFIEIASGKSPHSTILLLHGVPGTEKNTDMAHVFRRGGFNVAMFSYRGNWGSKGNYSFKHCIEDAHNVITFLKNNADKYRINPDDIIVIGNSLGGFNSLYTVFKEPSISKVASISGFHLNIARQVFQKEPTNKEIIEEVFKNSMNALEGTTPQTLMEEISAIDSWDFKDYYSTLASKDLLLISAGRDTIVPPDLYEEPVVDNLLQYNPKKFSHISFNDSGHSYSDHRIRLTKTLLDWLQKD